LLILSGHFLLQNRQSVPAVVLHAFSQYWSGVDLFFVLSGYVIFASLTRLNERRPGIPTLLRLYLTSRAFRILPVYALFLSAYFYLPRLNPQLAHDELFISSIPNYVYLYFGQAWMMAFRQRAGAGFVDVSWSLCAEVFLYGLAFVIVCLTSNRNRIWVVAAVAVISYTARLYIVLFTGNFLAAYLLPVCRMDGFMFGGIIAHLYTSHTLKDSISKVLSRALPILFCVFVVLAVGAWHFASGASILFSYSFYALFYTAVLVTVIRGDFPVLSKGPLKFIGTVSYFIYLFHFPIVYWMKNISDELRWGVLTNFSVTFAVTIGAATISWFLMEKPLIALGKTLNRRAQSY
jgi:peptidoglycan/LPS O-acetylase OafA/YrhL